MPELYYYVDKNALVWIKEPATPEYWNKSWEDNIDSLRVYLQNYKSDYFFIPVIRRFLEKGSIVVEGGCGVGQLVCSLNRNGYKAIGIDFAESTINRVKAIDPELDLRVGDVRSLDIENESVDAHISGGVIEHFTEGYAGILEEMYRTLKPGGKALVSFPYINALRRLKIKTGVYPVMDNQLFDANKDDFYQFGFHPQSVVRVAEKVGFKHIESHRVGALKGLKDELPFLKPILQPIFNYAPRNILVRCLKKSIDIAFHCISPHMIMLVLEKK